MNTKKHDIQVFISHARNDDLVADEVAKALTEQGLIVWSDESIAPGSDWKKEIQPARYAGNGSWNCLNVSAESDWSMMFIGNAIKRPSEKT